MNVTIRNYRPSDAEAIGNLNFLFQLSYQYNADFKPDNIFCAEIDS